MKKFLLLALCQFIVCAMLFAQGAAPAAGGLTLIGKIVDAANGKGVEAASVQLFQLEGDSTNGLPPRRNMVGGMLTRPNGDFSLEKVPAGKLELLVTAIGYKEMLVPVTTAGGSIKDIGNVTMTADADYLNSVTVVAEKPALQMGIDRKIFDVSKSLTSSGGTAIDVMRNIPSVSVDVDGNVELRNSSPQIYVDGRPTILTLDQIPADAIDRVELITNPSAKFDASSSGGIINVVLKKNKRIGFNGLASVGAGTPGVLTGGLNLNLRQGKLNFYAAGDYNRSGGKAKGETLRQNKEDGEITDYFNQYSKTDRTRRFQSARFGVDYFMDNRNSLSLSQHLVNGRFGNEEDQDQQYLDAHAALERYGARTSESNFEFNRNNTRLNFTHKFPEEGKELTADVNYNSGTREQHSTILNTYYYANGDVYQDPSRVRNEGSTNSHDVTIQADYVNPISEDSKLETGVRTYMNHYESFYNAYSVDDAGDEKKLPLSNNYTYEEMVSAAYVTYSNKMGSIGYQVGLRAEYSKFTGELVDSALSFGYEYPDGIKNLFNALFPSVFLTKQVGDGDEIQLNYSRRIRRPDFRQLNPFIDIDDPVNLDQGNPQLQPEFINSFEFNYNKIYTNGSFLGVLYFRNNPNDITQYSDTITAAQYEQLNNAAVDPNAILNTYINANTTNRYGAEFTLQHKLTKNFEVTPTIDLQYRKVNAGTDKVNLSNEGFNWEAKLISSYKLETPASPFWNNLSVQLSGQYEAPRVIPQGRRIEEFSIDMGLRKEFLKDRKGTLTFNVRDLLNTRKWGTIYDTEAFYQYSYRRWGVRNIKLSFSYRFGDPEFSLFRNRHRSENGGNESFDGPGVD